MKSNICFLDIETTGLDPARHEPWEVGLIYEHNGSWHEKVWFLPVWNLEKADPIALNIGKFWERYPEDMLEMVQTGAVQRMEDYCLRFAWDFRRLTWGKHLCGAIVSFDEERLRKFLHLWGQPYGWHYHIVDIEAMIVGFLAAHGAWVEAPWKSDLLYELMGVQKDEKASHTALGDARAVKVFYDIIRSGRRP